MNKFKQLVKFDFYTVKPYITLKNFIIFFIVGIFMVYNAKSTTPVGGVVMMMGSIYISYPFAISEQNGFETLTINFGISREEKVIGRYIWGFIIYLIGMVISFVLPIILNFSMGFEIFLEEILITSIVLFIIFTIIMLIQFPIFFKFGYTKSRFLSFIPFLLIFAGILVFDVLISIGMTNLIIEHISGKSIVAIFVGGAVFILATVISIRKSIDIYRLKDIE